MNLKTYFEETKGLGVLSTADADGRVNAAVYARPYVMEDGSLAFIMRDRLSHHNLESNPHAAFLFREEGPGYKGVRLHLTKTREETGTQIAHLSHIASGPYAAALYETRMAENLRRILDAVRAMQ